MVICLSQILGRQILIERSTQCRIDKLDPSAYAKDRFVCLNCFFEHNLLHIITHLTAANVLERLLAVQLGRDIMASGKKNTVTYIHETIKFMFI